MPEPPKNEYKNQHYIPQFYLKGFDRPEAPGRFHVFKNGHQYWSGGGLKQIASEDYLHSFRDKNGEMNHEIEIMLGRLENEFNLVLSKVLNEEALNRTEQLTFATFVVVMWQRVPASVDRFNDQTTQLLRKTAEIAYHRGEGEAIYKLSQEEFERQLAEVTANRHATFMSMMKSAIELSEYVLRMGWTFIKSEGSDFFITSDHPFCMFDPTNKSIHYGTGLRHRNVQISLPLSRNLAFYANWETTDRGCGTAHRDYVEVINRRTARSAARELIAPSRDFPGVDKPLAHFYTGIPKKPKA